MLEQTQLTFMCYVIDKQLPIVVYCLYTVLAAEYGVTSDVRSTTFFCWKINNHL